MSIVDTNTGVEATMEDSYSDVSSPKSMTTSEEPILLDIDSIKAAKQLRKQTLLAEKRLREEEEKEYRKKKALKGMSYLLQKSQSYAAFFEEKILAVGKGKKQISEKNRLEPTIKDVKGSDLSKIKSEAKEEIDYSDVTQHMKYFEGGALRPYQVQGVTWMMVLFENGLNGILADEMGLGKTVQVIALISHLYERLMTGPFLIIAPLSTVTNWKAEFERFAPQLPVLVLHGTQTERARVIRQIAKRHYVENRRVSPVVLTSYSTTLTEIKGLKQFRWEYVIVDEGHRLKNHNSKLSIELRTLQTSNRLLLTGTPLQNNITELWALLNFLLPFIFKDMDTFTSLFLLEDIENEDKILKEEESSNVISTIHKVLAPFMLRRTKNDVLIDLVPKKEVLVYCPLSKLQKDIYSYVIEKNIAKLRGHNDEDDTVIIDDEDIENYPLAKRRKYTPRRKSPLVERSVNDQVQHYITRVTMQNPMSMFKKVVDHPYLIHFPLDPTSEKKSLLVNNELITSSGKMMVLDAMLTKLKTKGHKVLIFSTLVMLLDMVEEYMIMKHLTYCRLDGSQSLDDRTESISEFNRNPDVFCFLLSTRAGGLGVNLTGADTVIFFDRDWNPQADIQAQDRCHRIGQTKPVVVYTLVTKNTIDERILALGHVKRRLEKIVIKDGKFKMVNNTQSTTESELLELQQLLKSGDKTQKIHSNGLVYTDEELDKLLDRSDLYEQMKD